MRCPHPSSLRVADLTAVPTSDFDYDLPKHMIAQAPAEPRDASRLLVLHRDDGRIEHRVFRDLGEYLNHGDLLVLNQTRVIPARLYWAQSRRAGVSNCCCSEGRMT